MAILDPISFPAEWDVIDLASITTPGVVEAFDGAREHGWDTKKGKGTVGGTSTFVEKPPTKFKIKFMAWLPEHFDAWSRLLPLISIDPTKKQPTPNDIYHPALAEVGITSVVTASIGIWKHEGGGLYSRTIEFLEYFPASLTSAVSTPTGSKADAPKWVDGAPPGDQPDSAVNAAQKEANDLAKQAQKAAA